MEFQNSQSAHCQPRAILSWRSPYAMLSLNLLNAQRLAGPKSTELR